MWRMSLTYLGPPTDLAGFSPPLNNFPCESLLINLILEYSFYLGTAYQNSAEPKADVFL